MRQKLTPAKTLVMSSTRVPAKGNVGDSAAAVASPRRQEEQIGPLGPRRSLSDLKSFSMGLDEAMMSSSTLVPSRLGYWEKNR